MGPPLPSGGYTFNREHALAELKQQTKQKAQEKARAATRVRRVLGFLEDTNRMNVALTRARYSCLVVGDERALLLSRHWSAFLDNVRRIGRIVDVGDPGQLLIGGLGMAPHNGPPTGEGERSRVAPCCDVTLWSVTANEDGPGSPGGRSYLNSDLAFEDAVRLEAEEKERVREAALLARDAAAETNPWGAASADSRGSAGAGAGGGDSGGGGGDDDDWW